MHYANLPIHGRQQMGGDNKRTPPPPPWNTKYKCIHVGGGLFSPYDGPVFPCGGLFSPYGGLFHLFYWGGGLFSPYGVSLRGIFFGVCPPPPPLVCGCHVPITKTKYSHIYFKVKITLKSYCGEILISDIGITFF